MPVRSKSDETRARILSAAIDLFRRNGFAQTTMRDIAAEAGVALGGAYYYFESKDAIVLAFYDQAQQDLDPLLEQALASSKDLRKRLHALMDVKLRYFEPNRRLLGTLSAYADPEHPLSPFGERTAATRENDIRFFELALAGTKVPKDLMPHLPRMLWLYQMGIILFWIYDRSAEQRRTHALFEKSLALVVQLIRLSGIPLLRPLRRMVVDLVVTAAG